ncbi:hypothetical protein MKEN_01191400 [Mycena kentingensis (nom. inval.)]|nr:hypothetical protein MKEN_01191400 [Mycena kentingensis (nom. inval.)]
MTKQGSNGGLSRSNRRARSLSERTKRKRRLYKFGNTAWAVFLHRQPLSHLASQLLRHRVQILLAQMSSGTHTSKRRRIATTPAPQVPPHSLSRTPAAGTEPAIPPPSTTILLPLALPHNTDTLRVPDSLSLIEAATHEHRLKSIAQQQSDKGTESAYSRHVTAYVKYWDDGQRAWVANHPGCLPVPAMPITATKVAHFLLGNERHHTGQTFKILWLPQNLDGKQ